MLSALLIFAHLALAGGGEPVPTEEPAPVLQYDRCQLAVLMDWEQQQAMLFRVTTEQELDLDSGELLALSTSQDYGNANVLVAPVPFDNYMTEVLIFNGEQQEVKGNVPTGNPNARSTVSGMPVISVTAQGLHGYLYALNGTLDCKQE